MNRSVAVAVDDSESSLAAVAWAVDAFVNTGSVVHLLTVVSPLTFPVTPSAVPVGTAGAVAILVDGMEQQKLQAERYALRILTEVKKLALNWGLPQEQIESHVLPAAGGASGVADSIVKFAHLHKPDVLVLGSRGMGSFQRSLMSMIGLGSVSDYTVHNVHCPVAVHHNGKTSPSAMPLESRHILVAIDDSKHSLDMLDWALAFVAKPTDKVHIVSVASVMSPNVDDSSAMVAMVEAQRWEQEQDEALKAAQRLCLKVVEAAVARGMAREQLVGAALLPKGGASDVGESICEYGKQKGVHLVVVASRGMGALKRGLMSVVGLGSVSDYCLHQLPLPVLVYKS